MKFSLLNIELGRSKTKDSQERSTSNTYLGTDKAYFDQIATPIMQGKKNEFVDDDFDRIGVATTCAKKIGNTVGKMPMEIYQKGQLGKVKDKKDRRYDLVHTSPDDNISSFNFWSTLETNRAFTGNAYAKIIRNGFQEPMELRLINPLNIVENETKKVNGKLVYTRRWKEGDTVKEEKIHGRDLLHFRDLTDCVGIFGRSPITSMRQTISSLWKEMETVDKFFTNSAQATKVVQSTIPDAKQWDDFEEGMERFKDKYRGVMNTSETIFMAPFSELKEIGLQFFDAVFIDSLKLNITQIAAFYGVPADQVGILDFTKFNNVESAQINFKANTIQAISVMYRRELDLKLLTKDERDNGKSIEFNTNSLVELDTKSKMAMYKGFTEYGNVDPNYVNNLEGFPTYEGGDTKYITNQLTPVGQKPKENNDK